MSLNIETDLVKILEKIDSKIDKLDERMTEIEKNQVKLDGDIKILGEKLSGKINTLDEKVDGLSKRVDEQGFVNRGVLIGLIVAIAGGAAKLFGFVGNP